MKSTILGVLAIASAFAMAAPTAAHAQYGGGGGPPVGIFGISFGSQPATPAASTANPGGQVLGASAYNFAHNFGIGATGADVTALQQFLTQAGVYAGPVTGYFGPLTKAAVEAYQTANNISPVSGYVGPLTRTLLNKGITPTASQEQSSILENLYAELTQALKHLAALSAST